MAIPRTTLMGFTDDLQSARSKDTAEHRAERSSSHPKPDHPTLQKAVGNGALGSFIRAKLSVSQPGDAYEQEADRVADQVMRMPEPATAQEETVSGKTRVPHIQRMCSDCAEEEQHNKVRDEEEQEPLQRKAVQDGTYETIPEVNTWNSQRLFCEWSLRFQESNHRTIHARQSGTGPLIVKVALPANSDLRNGSDEREEATMCRFTIKRESRFHARGAV